MYKKTFSQPYVKYNSNNTELFDYFCLSLIALLQLIPFACQQPTMQRKDKMKENVKIGRWKMQVRTDKEK